jgi:outer membrane protein OmpA-like peptidoglycan-associated protein
MMVVRLAVFVLALALPAVLAASWVSSASDRLAELESTTAKKPQAPTAAVAAAADETYCTPELRKVLRRVLQSCGLLGAGGSGRGCQPLEAKNVATVSGADFNSLFQPMKNRGGIVQFEAGKADLLGGAQSLVDGVFSEQGGASYFFVVSRASPEGSTEFNRKLSRQRAESVMTYLRQKFADPDLDKEVGLLWLGEEFAQLDQEFCQWKRSAAGECRSEDINRSAFVAWIDCRL